MLLSYIIKNQQVFKLYLTIYNQVKNTKNIQNLFIFDLDNKKLSINPIFTYIITSTKTGKNTKQFVLH